MACMLNYLNDLAEKHVVTLEDPIDTISLIDGAFSITRDWN